MSVAGIALTEPYRQRVSTGVEFRYEITNYGSDNLYPQKVKMIILNSPVAKKATFALSDFLRGGGWEENGDMVINDSGQTLNELLREATENSAFFNGFVVHVNTNILGGITDMRITPFEFTRYGLPNAFGQYKDMKLSNNWEGNRVKTIARGQEKILTFPLWGVDPETIKDSNEGFIFYVVPHQNIYPLAVGDAVLDSAQTEAEIQVFELGGIQNGFLGTSIFRHPGKITDPIERAKVINMLRQLKGSTGANGIGLLEVPIGFENIQLIENLPANNQDSLFEKTGKNVVDRILMNYGMPPAIIGKQPDTGMFNQQQLEDSYVYYNVMTRDRRNAITEAFTKILSFWHTGPVEVVGIIENTFNIDNGGAETNNNSETN